MTVEKFIQEIVQEKCTAIIEPLEEDMFIEGTSPDRGVKIKIINANNRRSTTFKLTTLILMNGGAIESHLKKALDFVGRYLNRK